MGVTASGIRISVPLPYKRVTYKRIHINTQRSTIRGFIYVFDKLDGSNIRTEWSRKIKEFYKFGCRTQLIDKQHLFLWYAVGLIRNKYQDELCRIFKNKRWHKIVAFSEYWSPNSFVGYHIKEPHNVTLIDVNFYKHSIMNLDEFIKLFGHTGIPNVVYCGNMNHKVEQQI